MNIVTIFDNQRHSLDTIETRSSRIQNKGMTETYQSINGLKNDDEENEYIEPFEHPIINYLLWVFNHRKYLYINPQRQKQL